MGAPSAFPLSERIELAATPIRSTERLLDRRSVWRNGTRDQIPGS